VPVTPVSDVIRFLETGVFGRYAWDDFGFGHDKFGNLERTDDEIRALKSWSPMQNLAKLRAPLKPTLVVTAALDERVDPEQAYAITDALQNRFGAKAPVFLWVEPNAGHFAATEVAELSFIAKEFRVKALNPLIP
jgi:prolyl oligopeptidase PreP (S9A serine peptidase family)